MSRGKEYFQSLMNESREERIEIFKNGYDITDIEYLAYDFYYKITKSLKKNMANESGREKCEKEKELLEDMLSVRRSILDKNFAWTKNYRNKLFELNKKVREGFSLGYGEAKTQFSTLKKRIEANDPYLTGFYISIELTPLFPMPYSEMPFVAGWNFSCLLQEMLPDPFWTESMYFEHDDIRNLKPKIYENVENFFTDRHRILSWFDILQITDIRVEVNVLHEHFIKDIGKGVYWDDGIQSLSENEAENIRQVYMSSLPKDVTGLPVHIFVDEMNCWEKIGPFRRIKIHGNKVKTIDHKRLYSMSIEENPRILVKDAQIDLTGEELQQVKDFVSKHRESLKSIAEGKTHLYPDFAKTLGHWME